MQQADWKIVFLWEWICRGHKHVSCFPNRWFIQSLLTNSIPVTKLMLEWRQSDYNKRLTSQFELFFNWWNFSYLLSNLFHFLFFQTVSYIYEMLSKIFIVFFFISLMPQSEGKSFNLPTPQCQPSVIDTMPQRVRKFCETLGTIWEFSDAMNNYLDEKGKLINNLSFFFKFSD